MYRNMSKYCINYARAFSALSFIYEWKPIFLSFFPFEQPHVSIYVRLVLSTPRLDARQVHWKVHATSVVLGKVGVVRVPLSHASYPVISDEMRSVIQRDIGLGRRIEEQRYY